MDKHDGGDTQSSVSAHVRHRDEAFGKTKLNSNCRRKRQCETSLSPTKQRQCKSSSGCKLSDRNQQKSRSALKFNGNIIVLSRLFCHLVISIFLQMAAFQLAEGLKSRPISYNLTNSYNGYNQLGFAEPLFAGSEKPRLIPLVLAESGYSENSSVNLLCTVSQGHHESLTFDWFKDGQLLMVTSQQEDAKVFEGFSNSLNSVVLAPKIEKHSDHSLLRIARVQSHHSGRYTCSAKNQFGQDSSSVNLIVNGNYIYWLLLLWADPCLQ